MVLDFIKRIFKKRKIDEMPKPEIGQPSKTASMDKPSDKVESNPLPIPVKDEVPPKSQVKVEKDVSEKTDEDLEKELLEYSPEIFAQAKTPQMRKMIINIYRKMLEDKVDINNEKEVRKWFQKHPEVAQGGEPLPKPETYKREAPKVGRNDPCPCGSGKKYKKCCGK